MRAAILTTALVIAALALWANLRGAEPRDGSALPVGAEPAPVLPDVAAAPASEPTVADAALAPAPEPTYEPASTTAARQHVVVAGETLAVLAQRYYGDANRAGEIYAANRDQIRDPEQLHAGQALVIP